MLETPAEVGLAWGNMQLNILNESSRRSESTTNYGVEKPVQLTNEIAGWKLAIYTQRETN